MRGSLILLVDPRASGMTILPCPATIPMIFFGWMICGQEVFVPGSKLTSIMWVSTEVITEIIGRAGEVKK